MLNAVDTVECQISDAAMDELAGTKGTESMARLDPNLLKNCIINLVGNAIKYSPHGSTVSISLDIQDGNYQLVIKDQGIGIAEDDQKRLFAAFTRGKNVGEVSGTGLGLAIVKRAVELYGGAIHMESVINQGTTLFVTLPMNPVVETHSA